MLADGDLWVRGMNIMADGVFGRIRIRFALPPPQLQPYVTTFYLTEVDQDDGDDWIEDYLHPEWPNLRFHLPGTVQASIDDAPLTMASHFTISGPTSRATRFRIRAGRSWGIGLMPLGWARLIGLPADQYADRHIDGEDDLAFSGFQPLVRSLANLNNVYAAELSHITNHLLDMLGPMLREEGAIDAINSALLDPNIASVSDLASATGINIRTLERYSRRFFGFTPKLLLRRQRFLRSLARFMQDPTMNWLNALDFQYHDQAHFIRDFKRFMGMGPREYGRLPHPFLRAAVQARAQIAGVGVQGLHDPRHNIPTG